MLFNKTTKRFLEGENIREILLSESSHTLDLFKLLIEVLNERLGKRLIAEFGKDPGITVSGNFTLSEENTIVGNFNMRTFSNNSVLLQIESEEFKKNPFKFDIRADFIGDTVFSNDSQVLISLSSGEINSSAERILDGIVSTLRIGLLGLKGE